MDLYKNLNFIIYVIFKGVNLIMSLEQVRTSLSYPLSSPGNSTYLALNHKRCYLSILDQVYSVFIRLGLSSTLEFDPFLVREIWEKKIVLIEEKSKYLFFNQTICFDKAKLDEAHQSFISALREIRLDTLNDAQGSTFDRKVAEVAMHIFEQKANASGLRSLPTNFALSPKDFETVNLAGLVYLKNSRFMDCVDFVFYHLHEEQAFPNIFNPNEPAWPPELTLDPVNFMSKWGYKLVAAPQPGDVVIYSSTLEGITETKHLGIWNDKKCVTSKWGRLQVYEHDLEDVLISYGSYVQFFRKRYKLGFQKALAEKVQAAKKGIRNFNHPSTRSPLTSQGAINYFIRKCADDLSAQMERTLEGSICGRRALDAYREILLSKMCSITASEATDKSIVLDKLEAVAESAARELTIDFRPISATR